MTLGEYQKSTYIAIQPHIDDRDELLNWSVGLSEECGEVMNHVKHCCWGGEDINEAEIAKEVGDVLWYLSALCTVLHLDLEVVAEINQKKLEHRFGNNFSEEKSKERHNLELRFENTQEYQLLLRKLVKKGD